MSSPIDTTSAPKPSFLISLIKFILVLDFTAKQINEFKDLKFFLKLFIFPFNFLYE